MGQEVSTLSSLNEKESSLTSPQDDPKVTVTAVTTSSTNDDASNGTFNSTTKTTTETPVTTNNNNNEYTFDQVFKTKDGTQSPNDSDSSLSSQESSSPILSPSASHSTANTPFKSFQNVFTLPNSELLTRLNSTTLTKESILQANNIIAQYNLSSDTFYINTTQEIDHHTAIAMHLLQHSQDLKLLRFKLVPSKLKEDAFWYSIFFLCMTKEEQYELVHSHTDDIGDSHQSERKLYKLVQSQSQDIVKLQLKVAELQLALKQALEHPKVTRVEQEEDVEVEKEKVQQKGHSGTWIMEKESIEFLELDQEIKKKLRDGKQKRLQDVHEQMKFILDSDEIQDSRGKWDCCGCETYGGTCGSAKC